MSDCLHRISRHCAEASWPLLDRGILTIGHSGLGSAEFLEKAMAAGSYNDLNEEFRAEYGRVPQIDVTFGSSLEACSSET